MCKIVQQINNSGTDRSVLIPVRYM